MIHFHKPVTVIARHTATRRPQFRLLPHVIHYNVDNRIAAVCVLFCLTISTCLAQLPDFTSVAEQNMPSVVTIVVKKDIPTADQQDENNSLNSVVPDDSKLKEFFDGFFKENGESMHVRLKGSGLVISSNGYIITVAHLVKDATKITVQPGKKRKYQAEIIGIDDDSDIAVIKIKNSALRTPVFGDAGKLKVGEWVLSIGAPFGFEKSASLGIVSALNRKLSNQNHVRYLQTDVAVNPGNSGGPLFNINGEVVGINTQIFSNSGRFQGVSFAIPIGTALDIAKKLGAKTAL